MSPQIEDLSQPLSEKTAGYDSATTLVCDESQSLGGDEVHPTLENATFANISNISTITGDVQSLRERFGPPPGGLVGRQCLRASDEELMDVLRPPLREGSDLRKIAGNLRRVVDANFQANMHGWVTLAKEPVTGDELVLDWLLQVGACWLHHHAHKEVEWFPATVRARILQVDQSDPTQETGSHRENLFIFRRSSSKLPRILDAFLRFWWRFPTSAFDNGKARVREFYDDPRRLLSATSSCPVIGDFLMGCTFGMLFRPVVIGDPIVSGNPFGVLFAAVLMFDLQDQRLVMYEPGWGSTRVSDYLHIMRASVCSYMSGCWDDWGGDEGAQTRCCEYASALNNGSVWSQAMVWIRNLRALHDQIPKCVAEWVDEDGNVFVGDFEFRKSIWSRLIPEMIAMAEENLEKLCLDDKWRYFMDLNRYVWSHQVTCCFPSLRFVVRSYAFFLCCPRNIKVQDWNSLSIVVSDDDGDELRLDRSSISMEAKESRKNVEGLVLLSLMGLGLGPARFSEILSLSMRSICYEHGYIRYATLSVKKGSFAAKGVRKTERRLPRSLSRLTLVYAALVGNSNSGFFFGQQAQTHHDQMGLLCRTAFRDLFCWSLSRYYWT